MSSQEVLNIIGLILLAAILAQYIAWNIKVPAIILLTLFGFVLGPILNWVQPREVFNHLFDPLIEFAVVVLLFEGGLNLKFKTLRDASFGVKRLITLGVIFNGLITTCAAHYIAGLSWQISSVIGSILIVTGPTVIIPILRQVNLPKKISQYLRWEAIVNDPLGVLITAIVYQCITYDGSDSTMSVAVMALIKALGFASLITFIIGPLVKYIFDKTRFPDFFKVPSVLAIILLIFIVSKKIQDGSGLLAVTLLGMYFANKEMLVLSDLRKFKESISVFSVSLVFILLSASIDLSILQSLNFKHIVFVLLVVLVLRLVAIFSATMASDMKWQERILIGWFGPRGIVAASVAGIIGLRLQEHHLAGAEYILPIIFSIVCLTVLIHGVTLAPIANALCLNMSEGKGLVIAGASTWATELAKTLQELGVPVMIVDSTWYKLKGPRQIGINTHYGEIIMDVEEGHLDLNEYDHLLAATDSNSYNTLVCNSLAEDFGRNNVYQLPLDKAPGKIEELPTSQGGQVLESEELLFENLKQKLYYGWDFRKTTLTDEYSYERFKKDFNDIDSTHLMIIDKNKSIQFIVNPQKMNAKSGDTIISFTEKS